MSIAMEIGNSDSNHRIELVGFVIVHPKMACASSIYHSTKFSAVYWRCPAAQQLVSEYQSGSFSSSSISSIGNNIHEFRYGEDDGDEVRSGYKGGPLDCLDALEEVLPVKKSISDSYCGKSKSYSSLSDATSCSSTEDITKPENAYSKNRSESNNAETSSSNPSSLSCCLPLSPPSAKTALHGKYACPGESQNFLEATIGVTLFLE
ncbi:hypothetical protein ABFS83_12G129000 [Erythranthe nasuta]